MSKLIVKDACIKIGDKEYPIKIGDMKKIKYKYLEKTKEFQGIITSIKPRNIDHFAFDYEILLDNSVKYHSNVASILCKDILEILDISDEPITIEKDIIWNHDSVKKSLKFDDNFNITEGDKLNIIKRDNTKCSGILFNIIDDITDFILVFKIAFTNTIGTFRVKLDDIKDITIEKKKEELK